jgi:xeroderma pigmentosum group C-complementing protein
VDVWSEKCLPPGTVHFRFRSAYSVAKRLEIDSAPAMVGFEFKNGRAHPVYNGIVVCAEFKDILLEVFLFPMNKLYCCGLADELKFDL